MILKFPKKIKSTGRTSGNVVIIVVLLLTICGLGLYLGSHVDHRSLPSKVVPTEQRQPPILPLLTVSSNTVESPVPTVAAVASAAHAPPVINGQKSPHAYVTLISGLDKGYFYRGYLYNAIIMKRALDTLGSTADFIALIGYKDSDTAPYESDMELLRTHGIITYTLPRLLETRHKLGFAEMALLKITPYSFTQYKRIQFLDGDVMPTKNMDCFFELDMNAYTVGAVSPLNSGWYLAIPDMNAYIEMKEKALWRLRRDWDEINGWGEKMPPNMYYRGGKPCLKWLFNGADMDQGLFTHYFIINHGNALLVDTEQRKARVFREGIAHAPGMEEPMGEALRCCKGVIPTAHYSHFTGRSKPWLNPDLATITAGTKRNGDIFTWKTHLDSLNLPVNSSTIGALKLKPPLGYFNSNFPKGGYH